MERESRLSNEHSHPKSIAEIRNLLRKNIQDLESSNN